TPCPCHRAMRARASRYQRTASKFLPPTRKAMTQPLATLAPGEKRAANGTVAWLVAEYFSSPDFTGRPTSVRVKHRRHVEDFRVRRGDRWSPGLIKRLSIRGWPPC